MPEETKTGVARQYEIISKETGEVFPVISPTLGDANNDGVNDFTVTVEGTDHTHSFVRKGETASGFANFENESYLIRDRESKLAPNGVDRVEDVVL